MAWTVRHRIRRQRRTARLTGVPYAAQRGGLHSRIVGRTTGVHRRAGVAWEGAERPVLPDSPQQNTHRLPCRRNARTGDSTENPENPDTLNWQRIQTENPDTLNSAGVASWPQVPTGGESRHPEFGGRRELAVRCADRRGPGPRGIFRLQSSRTGGVGWGDRKAARRRAITSRPVRPSPESAVTDTRSTQGRIGSHGSLAHAVSCWAVNVRPSSTAGHAGTRRTGSCHAVGRLRVAGCRGPADGTAALERRVRLPQCVQLINQPFPH